MLKYFQRIIIIFVLLFTVFLFFQWNEYQDKVKLRDNAMLHFQENDYKKAISNFDKALKQYCIFSGALDLDMKCYKAESYYELDEYKKAIEIYDKLLDADKKNATFYKLEGECLQASKEYEKAVALYEEGWKNTQDISLINKICDIYMEQKKYKKALSYAKKGAKEGGDTKSDFLYEEIVIYEKAQDYESAYKIATEYCDLFPDDEKAQKELLFLSTRVQ